MKTFGMLGEFGQKNPYMVNYLHDRVHVARVAKVLQARVAGSVDGNQF